jgi:hypothetical protein
VFYKDREVRVVEAGSNLTLIADVDGHEYNVRTTDLTEKPIRKTRSGNEIRESAYSPYKGNEKIFDAKFVAEEKPQDILAQLDAFVIAHGQVIIGCGPAQRESALERLRSFGISNPDGFVRVYPEGHDMKIDLFIPDPKMPGVDLALGIFFGDMRLASSGLYQISRTYYISRLLSDVHVLESQDKLISSE